MPADARLTDALDFACSAVKQDAQLSYELAIQMYTSSVELLDQVLKQMIEDGKEEEAERLKSIVSFGFSLLRIMG